MLDWLNIKAGLSIAAVMLIASAGIWGEYQVDLSKDEMFEELLRKFVERVDSVSISGAFISFNITSSSAGSIHGDFIMESSFEGSPYQIILTGTHAAFVQDDRKFSQGFISRIKITESDEIIEPGTLVSDIQLDEIILLTITSGTNLTVTKILQESEYGIEPLVIIYRT